jgi:hypothetical protein
MVQIAQNPEASLELRGKMFSEPAHYVYPIRKAIEHAGDGDVLPIEVTGVRSIEDSAARVQARLDEKIEPSQVRHDCLTAR